MTDLPSIGSTLNGIDIPHDYVGPYDHIMAWRETHFSLWLAL